MAQGQDSTRKCAHTLTAWTDKDETVLIDVSFVLTLSLPVCMQQRTTAVMTSVIFHTSQLEHKSSPVVAFDFGTPSLLHDMCIFASIVVWLDEFARNVFTLTWLSQARLFRNHRPAWSSKGLTTLKLHATQTAAQADNRQMALQFRQQTAYQTQDQSHSLQASEMVASPADAAGEASNQESAQGLSRNMMKHCHNSNVSINIVCDASHNNTLLSAPSAVLSGASHAYMWCLQNDAFETRFQQTRCDVQRCNHPNQLQTLTRLSAFVAYDSVIQLWSYNLRLLAFCLCLQHWTGVCCADYQLTLTLRRHIDHVNFTWVWKSKLSVPWQLFGAADAAFSKKGVWDGNNTHTKLCLLQCHAVSESEGAMLDFYVTVTFTCQ